MDSGALLKYSSSPSSKHLEGLQFPVLPAKAMCVTSRQNHLIVCVKSTTIPFPTLVIVKAKVNMDPWSSWILGYNSEQNLSPTHTVCMAGARGQLLLSFSYHWEVICYHVSNLAHPDYHLLLGLLQHPFSVIQINVLPFSPKETTSIPPTAHLIRVKLPCSLAPGMGKWEEPGTYVIFSNSEMSVIQVGKKSIKPRTLSATFCRDAVSPPGFSGC